MIWSLQVEGSPPTHCWGSGDDILESSWRPGDHGWREGVWLAWNDAWMSEAVVIHLALDASLISSWVKRVFRAPSLLRGFGRIAGLTDQLWELGRPEIKC